MSSVGTAWVFARAQALSPLSFHGIRAWYRLKAEQQAQEVKGGGTTARGRHLFPLRVRHYTRVGALREAPANDIGSRSCLRQDEAIGIVYSLLDGILGLKNCVCASS